MRCMLGRQCVASELDGLLAPLESDLCVCVCVCVCQGCPDTSGLDRHVVVFCLFFFLLFSLNPLQRHKA